MNSLKVLKHRHTLQEALARATDFKIPMLRNDRRLFSAYADASKRLSIIGEGLRSVCRQHLDFDFTPPPSRAFGFRAAAVPFEETASAMEAQVVETVEQLVTCLNVPQLGRIEWADDEESCRFTFFEVERDYGWFDNTVRRIAHTHDLVKARSHKLPAADIKMPKRAIEIIKAIPEPLVPYVRVVTGLEVLKNVREQSRRTERTWLGQTWDGAKRETVEAAQAVSEGAQAALRTATRVVTSEGARAAAGVAAGVAAVAAAGAVLGGMLGTLAAQLAVVDPAIVIGEFCLYGWED